MSDLYARKKSFQPNRSKPLGYYPRSKRMLQSRDYYNELPRPSGVELGHLELRQRIPISYGIVVAELEKTQRQVQIMSSRLEKLERSPKQIRVRDVPLKDAEKQVHVFLKKYFKKHIQVYPSDVADALGLKYERVCEVFNALQNEGKIRPR